MTPAAGCWLFSIRMCINCVAQGAVYVGGAAGALRVMASRSSRRRVAEYQASQVAAATEEDSVEISTGTPHL